MNFPLDIISIYCKYLSYIKKGVTNLETNLYGRNANMECQIIATKDFNEVPIRLIKSEGNDMDLWVTAEEMGQISSRKTTKQGVLMNFWKLS